MIELNHVTKIYDPSGIGRSVGVEDINLKIGSKGLVSIFGPSGCGKTTLLNLIAGLDKPSSGEVLIDGQKVDDAYRLNHIGCIFQDFVVVDTLSVAENIRLLDKTMTDAHINEILDSLGILNLRDRKAGRLSGGEKQRVCIARAIARKPAFLVADEPTGNLDAANRVAIMDILKSLSKHYLVIMVSHEKELVERYSDRIVRMDEHRIESDESPEIGEGRFEIGANAKSSLPKKKIRKKRMNVIAGILSSICVMAASFAFSFATGKADSTNQNSHVVYRLSTDLDAETRGQLSQFSYLGRVAFANTLEVGDGWSPQTLYFSNSAPILSYDLYSDGVLWPYRENECVITSALAKSILADSRVMTYMSGIDLNASSLGLTHPDDLLGNRIDNIYVVKEIVEGNEECCFICPESFYAFSGIIHTEKYVISGIFFDSFSYSRISKVSAREGIVYVPSDSALAGESQISLFGKKYAIEAVESLNAIVLPPEAAARIMPYEGYACVYNSEGFSAAIKESEVEAKSLREIKQNSISQAKAFFASLIGGVGLVTLSIMLTFFFVDLSAYLNENRKELVVYRSLGVSKGILIRESLASVILGALPSISIGLLVGEALTLFICRNELAALYFVPGVATFLLGSLLSVVFVLFVSYLYLWRRFAMSAAEFKRINGGLEA